MEQEIISMYIDNQSVEKICNKFSISFGKLYRILDKHSISKDKRSRIIRKKKIDYGKISELYNNGDEINDMSKKLGISVATIYNAVDANRGYKRKFDLNEDYFSNIDNESKAYFLGLLYADGCNNGYGFYITLKKNDIDILYKLKDAIGFSGDLKFIREKYVMLNISSKKMADILSKHGCNINKTVNGTFPIMRAELYRHFIRGLFDGDGYIGIDKRKQACFSIVGNSNIIVPVSEILNAECNLKINVRKPKRYHCDISIYSFGGNKQAKRVMEFFYKDSMIYLQRKYLKFKEI